MNQTVSSKIKVRNFAIGFFGWAIFLNLLFLLLIFLNGDKFLSLTMWFLTITASLVMFFKKRTWNGIGILAYVVFNVVVWAIMLAGESIGDIFAAASYPLPAIFLLAAD